MDNLMSSMFNPETMKSLMENEEIKKMMNDPNLMGNLKNMMGSIPGMPDISNMSEECNSNSCNADENYDCETQSCNLPCENGECKLSFFASNSFSKPLGKA